MSGIDVTWQLSGTNFYGYDDYDLATGDTNKRSKQSETWTLKYYLKQDTW